MEIKKMHHCGEQVVEFRINCDTGVISAMGYICKICGYGAFTGTTIESAQYTNSFPREKILENIKHEIEGGRDQNIDNIVSSTLTENGFSGCNIKINYPK